MAAYSQAVIQGFLKVADQATTRAAKGKAFEDLICYLFEKVAGIAITQRNVLNRMESEEIDVALWNDGHPRGLKSLTNMLLVECKNWSAAVGSAEVITFISKLERRGVEYGFLFAANGITGSAEDGKAAHFAISSALAKKIRIVVITREDVETLKASDDLVLLIKQKLCHLVASETAWP
jgi:hypothetical protein